MLKYAMISISTLGLFSATPSLARAELTTTPSTPVFVSQGKTPVLANVCGNGIVEEGEVCDGGNNCSGDCKGGVFHAPANSGETGISKAGNLGELSEVQPSGGAADSPLTPVGEGPSYQASPSDGIEVIPSDPQQPPAHELAPVDKPEIGPLPGPAQCGNGAVESGEACDDGNTLTGDGCDGFCKIEDASDSQPLVDKTPRPNGHREDSAVGFGGSPLMSGSGCSLQSLNPRTNALSALEGILLLALPLLSACFRRRR